MDPNDHRILGEKLDLFHLSELSPGRVFWHPRGFRLYRSLEAAVREHFVAHGYAEVRTPSVMRQGVWESSGHWQHFYAGMFRIDDERESAALKPVSCPGHIEIARHSLPSYRDLPMRFAEFGVVHRDELAGTLHGLLRLREFTQDDGHIFCAEEDAAHEVERFCKSVAPFYRAFGFDALSVQFATRPSDRAGDDSAWDRAENALRSALEQLDLPFSIAEGGGAFYGPKIEFVLRDRLGRDWQCGTIQFDLAMPKSFDLRYVHSSGERRHVVMLHRALYGSLERFMGMLLEHHGASLPAWLAPEQAWVLPIGESERAYAREVDSKLRAAGIASRCDDRDESLAKRIVCAHELGVPFVLVIGAREALRRSVNLRSRNERIELSLDEALGALARRSARPVLV